MTDTVYKDLYLLYGEEKYLIKKYEAELKEAIVSGEMEMMNCDIFEGKAIESNRIIDAAMTLPFMSERRLVVIKESGLFTTGRKDETEKIKDFLASDLGTTTLVFIEEEIDKRNALYKLVAKKGEALEFKSPPEKELIAFVSNIFKKQKIKISPQAASHLLISTAGSMEGIVLETEKLISFKGKNTEIIVEDIDLVCTKALEVRIFELVGSLAMKNTKIALEVYHNLILMKESPLMILALIIRQFRLLLLTRYMDRKRKSRDEIAAVLGLRGFVVGECLKQSKNFSETILLNALNECLETDVNIKTGKMEAVLAVELLIIRYAQL